ncbi:MAG TPA: carbonic anhydrase [Pseudomonadales bacterium]
MLEKLLVYNQYWSGLQKLSDETYFERLSENQAPEYLWIGCADSRVPAEALLGLKPGQLFVHRNIANQIQLNDNNSMSVLQFAVTVLKVKHIIVCGHSGCGGIKAAYHNEADGYLGDWLSDLRHLIDDSRDCLPGDSSEEECLSLLTEMNVRHQVRQIADHPIVRQAWAQGQELDIHGWVFIIHDGLIQDLGVSVSGADQS